MRIFFPIYIFILLFTHLLSFPTLGELFDDIMKHFQGPIQNTIVKKYSGYTVIMNKLKFFHPVLTKTEKTELIDSLNASNIIVTINLTFGYTIDNFEQSSVLLNILVQANIYSLILKRDKITNKVFLHSLSVSNVYFDKYYDFMNMSFFKEFQNDIANNVTNDITGVIKKYIEILLQRQDRL